MLTILLSLLVETETLIMHPTAYSIRKDPSMKGAAIARIEAYQEFEVIDENAHPEYVKVSFNGTEGWLPKGIVASSRKETKRVRANEAAIAAVEKLEEERRQRAAEEREKQLQRELEERRKASAEREKTLLAKYGQKVGMKIVMHQTWIGMTPEQATDSWGEPDEVNKTVTAAGTREQWVYSRESKTDYLYFDNGLLSGIQTSR